MIHNSNGCNKEFFKIEESNNNLNINNTLVAKISNNAIKDKTTFNIKKNSIFYFKFKKYNFCGCFKLLNIKANVSEHEIVLSCYIEKNKKTIKETKFLTLKAEDIITVAVNQLLLKDKNSFIIAYYKQSNYKKTINLLRLHCDNRFECERFSSKLRNLYIKDYNYIVDIEDSQSKKNFNKNNFKLLNKIELSNSLESNNKLIKDDQKKPDLYDNPKITYYCFRLLEETININNNKYKLYFIKVLHMIYAYKKLYFNKSENNN